jgi:hypothetical protein
MLAVLTTLEYGSGYRNGYAKPKSYSAGRQASEKSLISCRNDKRCALKLHCTFPAVDWCSGGSCRQRTHRSLSHRLINLNKGAAPSASWGVCGWDKGFTVGIGASKAGGRPPARATVLMGLTIMLVCCSKVSPKAPPANA